MNQMNVSNSSRMQISSNKNGKFSWLESIKQTFSLPSSIIYHIAKNPSSSKVYCKLTQSCKYFFEKNPILVGGRIHRYGEKFCYNNSLKCNYMCCVTFDITRITSKIWLTKELDIFVTIDIPIFAPLIISKIYRCEEARLKINVYDITLKDFQLLASKFQKVCFLHGKLIHEDGSAAMLEEILESIPNVKEFQFHNPKSTASTMKNILQFKNLANLKLFDLNTISQDLNVSDLGEFMKRQKDTKFRLFFDRDISDGYKNQLDQLIDTVIASGALNRFIFYDKQDQEKLQIMKSRYDNLWS